MINLKFNSITGKLIFDNTPLEIDTEEGFFNSKLYEMLINRDCIKENIPHSYLVDLVCFYDKEFEVSINPICFGFPFMVQLVDKNSQYYKSLNDWNARTDIEMLNESVTNLSGWLRKSLSLGDPDIIEAEMVRWIFDWGRVSVSYETRSFDHGVYIVWNKNE